MLFYGHGAQLLPFDLFHGFPTFPVKTDICSVHTGIIARENPVSFDMQGLEDRVEGADEFFQEVHFNMSRRTIVRLASFFCNICSLLCESPRPVNCLFQRVHDNFIRLAAAQMPGQDNAGVVKSRRAAGEVQARVEVGKLLFGTRKVGF